MKRIKTFVLVMYPAKTRLRKSSVAIWQVATKMYTFYKSKTMYPCRMTEY